MFALLGFLQLARGADRAADDASTRTRPACSAGSRPAARRLHLPAPLAGVASVTIVAAPNAHRTHHTARTTGGEPR